MQCPQCKADVESKSLFCPECGNRLKSPPDENGGATATERYREAVANRQQSPTDPESPIWQGSYSPKAMVGAWLGGGIATIVAVVLGATFLQAGQWWMLLSGIFIMWAALALTYLYRRFSVKYLLTNRRFVHESGLLWRVINRVELIDIDDVTCAQGPVERMLNVGTIEITSTDRSHPTLALRGIDDARKVASTIDDKRLQERRRRAIYTESV